MHANNKFPDTVKENFEYFLNQAFAPFAILKGKELRFIFANAAYVSLMNGRQLVGEKLEDAIPELKGQPFLMLLQHVIETGTPFHTPEIAATALFNGDTTPSTRYFNLSYTPYKNQEGTTEGVLASGFDITKEVALKNAEGQQLLNLQAYDLFMQAPVGFSLVMGDDHRLTLANETGLRIAGKGPEIIGKPITEILPGIESQGYIDLLNRVKQYGETIQLVESPVRLIKNGKEETIYVNLVYQPYYEQNKIAGVLSISTDVTQLFEAKKEAEELRQRFEDMANHIPVLAWMANTDGWIFWYNSRWYEYTGTTPEQMEGWGWQSVHDPQTLPAVMENWQSSIQSGKPFEMVFPIKGADNTYRSFLTRVSPIRDSDGHILRWFGTNTDITKQIETERIKDNFLSIASHELKTPITTIKAYGQIAEKMLEKNGDVETLEIVKKMRTQVKRLTLLIDDLLDTEKIQKGKLKFNEDHYDFNTLVREVVYDMQKITSTHKIQMELVGDPVIFGDRDKISQVINNLLSNAIKYSPAANQILLKTALQSDGVLLSVRDFGIGISPAQQPQVFDQFFRVAGENQSTFPGMGIGLYICSEIIKRQGGKIWLESTLGEGSIFSIWLPVDHRKE